MTIIWHPLDLMARVERDADGMCTATLPGVEALEAEAKSPNVAVKQLCRQIEERLGKADPTRGLGKQMNPHHYWALARLRAILDEENIEHRVDPDFLEEIDFMLVAVNPHTAPDSNV